MYQVISGNDAPKRFADLVDAAKTLTPFNILDSPKVIDTEGRTLIEVQWRYIPGDCYEPCGYIGNTPEARIALSCARALQRIHGEIAQQAREAMKGLVGVSFQSSSDEGKVDVTLSWQPWPGFVMEIHAADTGYIVYSPWLDSAWLDNSEERSVPEQALRYYTAKAGELGVNLPEQWVDIIRRRALVNA